MHPLLEALLADRDDDAPRLVYADALMQEGDPLGELIAVQCALARCDASDPARSGLAERSAEIERTLRAAWLSSLGLSTEPLRFVRGFVEEITAPFSVATTNAAAFLARLPLLERLDLSIGGQRDRAELARPRSTELLVRARQLAIRGKPRANRGQIADSSGLREVPFTRLSSLRLERLRFEPAKLADLLAAPALARLDTLALVSIQLDALALATATARAACTQLTRLVLHGNQIGYAGVVTVVRSPLFANVTELGLRGTGVSEAVLTVLANAPSSLRYVDLVDTGVDQAAVERVRPPFEVNLERNARTIGA